MTVSIGINPVGGSLLPTYLRVVVPATASVATGSVYVYMSSNLYTTDWLLHGDYVELGTPDNVSPPYPAIAVHSSH